MKIIEAEQAQYLIKSLQHHPSPYIIYDKDSGVEWLNNSAQYIFNLKDDESISIEPITDVKKIIINLRSQDLLIQIFK